MERKRFPCRTMSSCMACVVAGSLLSGCGKRGDSDPSFERAPAAMGHGQLLEGLPFRSDLNFETEKGSSDTVELFGEWFYETPVELPKEELAEIGIILSAEGSLLEWTGDKLCGGFHPDWLFRISKGGQQTSYVICFGCHEVKRYVGETESVFDSGDSAYKGLFARIGDLRVNRPEPSFDGDDFLR